MIVEAEALLKFINAMTPESLSNWINKLTPRNRFAIENCLMGLARDHNRRVSLLNQHIGFAVRERATLQQLGRLLFNQEPAAEDEPLIARIRNNAELRRLFDGFMDEGYDEEVESLTRVNVNPLAGEQVFSIILAKHHYSTAPPSSQPQLRTQLNRAGGSAPAQPPCPMEIVDLCSDSEEDDDGSSYACENKEDPEPGLSAAYVPRPVDPPMNPLK